MQVQDPTPGELFILKAQLSRLGGGSLRDIFFIGEVTGEVNGSHYSYLTISLNYWPGIACIADALGALCFKFRASHSESYSSWLIGLL